ncbi:hypothetical protein C0992_003839 [Termitomyces sp. T32_za158]|nr:hypothetical protein C0992_003839 [Termitomyces sp. T32_za158]
MNRLRTVLVVAPWRRAQPAIARQRHRTRFCSSSSLAVSSAPPLEPIYNSRTTDTTPTSTTTTTPTTPMCEYQKLIAGGALRGDDHQTRIIQKLQDLHSNLIDYNPPRIPELTQSPSLLTRLFTRNAPIPSAPPRGLYLYGDVGTGKTMLMDLFYKALPAATRKRRVHFHAFMVDVHKRVHAAKIAMGFNGGDPIVPVARDLANEACVLCFDEFQVRRGGVRWFKSADGLFVGDGYRGRDDTPTAARVAGEFRRGLRGDVKNGIQRSSFMPAIELLKTRFEVTDLDSGTDYRRIPRALSRVYYDPLTAENAREIERVFTSLTGDADDPPIRNRRLDTWGRTITIPESTRKVAKFRFEDLCGQPLSAADYLEVTKTFATIFMLEVPKMGMDSKDKARRFITFIDACYENHVRLYVTSEVPVERVFSDDAARSADMRSVMDDFGVTEKSALFTGEEEVFAFVRACSRLVEMGSSGWGRA